MTVCVAYRSVVPRLLRVLLGLICLTTSGTTFGQAPAPQLPFFEKHCLACHGPESATAEVQLAIQENPLAARQDGDTWEKVADVLEFGLMPPPEEEQPSQAEREAAVEWIRGELKQVECSDDPGRATLRRLNRLEYRNTIRDLLGVNFATQEAFPSDDVGYGFDNMGDVLSVSPLLLEKYLAAAEEISQRVIETGAPQPPLLAEFAAHELESSLGTHAEDEPGAALSLHTQGEISAEVLIDEPGKYDVIFRAYETPAGEEASQVAIKVDDAVIKKLPLNAKRRTPAELVISTKLSAGSHKLSLEFLNDFYDETNSDPQRRDRNVFVRSLQIRGPQDSPYLMRSPQHRKVIYFEPSANPDKWEAELQQVLSRVVSRAFRRAATKGELKRLVELASKEAKASSSFESGVQLGLQAILSSPHFLFRVERDQEGEENADQAPRPLNEYELATRLSYFLWSTMPDEELFKLASKKQLRENLKAQVRRMLADPKAQALPENFGRQWLTLGKLELVTPDPQTFPEFDEELRLAMRKETELLFTSIMREDRSVLEFMTADYTFVNERLARHYGLPDVSGGEFRQVSLKGTGRGGVLTHASVLTLTSNPGRTSPVKRGKWVLEQLLGTPPPPPPPGAGELPEGKEATGTVRQRLEQHRQNPMCASCHARMDPIGFGLENFNALGAWRDQADGQAIDNSGELAGGRKFQGPAELRKLLLERPEKFRRALATKMLIYAVGRGTLKSDRCTLDQICQQLESQQDRFSALVEAIVESRPFQMRGGIAQP